ncbi:small GTP-binding protein domain protein [Paenisporosarcina sp. HGH0030]|uniref:GTP-binding protein n=1 Tax=Paenisporosarcina sp. HGH0030 TaxID=1078085 RepID=UPI00034ECA74|nr:TetM/TetW/TetO/TetS family tetracycline resistance ribosomal protection protein [Paenisporosarcina sp. HGH0030]EPD50231.1 small GTP-binding protein domain protein [Paenisporosarcina sp. HGH0030]
MNKTIGVFAHVDAGKTTFSEQILYHTKSIKHRGRVDHKDAFLDSHEIERQRGITVFADQATFTYKDSTYYLIDNPGHVDFSPEMERSVQVMDYAIVILSAVEGIEGHTATIWQLLRKHHVPTFFFINKTDRTGADVKNVVKEIQEDFSADVIDITQSFHEGEMTESLIESIAERNENLLEHYMEDGYEKDLWINTMKDLIKDNKVFPCASGSALQDIGIVEFLDKFHQLTETQYTSDEAFSGRVYKVRHDEKGTRITFIKSLSGTLSVRDEITYSPIEQALTEKITQIRVYNGNKFKTVEHVKAGELFAVSGLTNAVTGDGLGTLYGKADYEMVPTLKSKVVIVPSVHIKDALKCFQLLDVEDPSLNVMWEERLQEIHIHVMGAIQLEILKQLVAERFHFEVEFEEPQILYKETINSTTIGYGHFEPLKHYAEVHLKMEPARRNSGITFDNVCHANHLSVGNQNLVKHHLLEKAHNGLLTGSPLTDIKVTLLTGRADNMHTSGGDFREATYRALRQGVEKASNLLLEPFYDFRIKVDVDQMGKVLSDIQMAHGSFDSPKTEGHKVILTGKVPVATFMNYAAELASFTQGKGVLNLMFGGYEQCHNEDEVIQRIAYNKDADPEYSSSSIFCAKGKGYTVPWERAEELMHCL